MAKKIFVIVENLNVDKSSGARVNYAMVSNLVAIGYDIRVLHYSHKEIQIRNIDIFRIHEKRFNLWYVLGGLVRIIARYTGLNMNAFIENFFGFSFTFFNDIKSIKAGILRHKNFKPDLLITLSQGASYRTHYAVLQIPELHKIWLAYFHDPYPFHLYPRPYNWVQPGYRRKERFIAQIADYARCFGFPSKLLMEWMGSYFPKLKEIGFVIPHQNELFSKGKGTKVPDYFAKEKFTLLHAGNLMKQRSPHALIEAFQYFLEQIPQARKDSQLLLVGPADYYSDYLYQKGREIPQLLIKNSNLPFAEVYQLQMEASVNIILESNSEISPFLPGKFPHCIQADKPILLLSPYYSETLRLLGNDYSFWSEADNTRRITELLKDMYLNWKKNSTDFRLNRPDLLNYVGIEHFKKEIGDVIRFVEQKEKV